LAQASHDWRKRVMIGASESWISRSGWAAVPK
jgi:hypothetical protein